MIDKEEIIKSALEGLTYTQISEKYGISRNMVASILYRNRHFDPNRIPKKRGPKGSRMWSEESLTEKWVKKT